MPGNLGTRERELAAVVPELRRRARQLVRDADEAEDLVQDALVVAFCQPPPAGVPLGPWLVGVLRNLHRRWVRTRVRRERRESLAAEPLAAPAADDADPGCG